jgi:hypothetical protein
MPKSLWFPDDDFEQLVTLAKQAGFRVSRGRGSQLRLFVMAAANNACTLTGGILPSEKPLFHPSICPAHENYPSPPPAGETSC